MEGWDSNMTGRKKKDCESRAIVVNWEELCLTLGIFGNFSSDTFESPTERVTSTGFPESRD